ncbi:hypothetical protein TNCV_560061 [Trichonephila clavipes]|nr:hypothetical protein TNCV_560061 [Trichonephila clavipes]
MPARLHRQKNAVSVVLGGFIARSIAVSFVKKYADRFQDGWLTEQLLDPVHMNWKTKNTPSSFIGADVPTNLVERNFIVFIY